MKTLLLLLDVSRLSSLLYGDDTPGGGLNLLLWYFLLQEASPWRRRLEVMKQAESIQSLIVLLLESQQTVSSLYFYNLFAELLCRRSILIMMIIMIIDNDNDGEWRDIQTRGERTHSVRRLDSAKVSINQWEHREELQVSSPVSPAALSSGSGRVGSCRVGSMCVAVNCDWRTLSPPAVRLLCVCSEEDDFLSDELCEVDRWRLRWGGTERRHTDSQFMLHYCGLKNDRLKSCKSVK